MRRLFRLCLALLLSFALAPIAQAAVTITFWSHELGNHFPHAFITLRGTPDAGGAPVDANYGFTAKSISPAILMGKVKSRMDVAKPAYVDGSDAQFSMVLTDAQYADMLSLIYEWSRPEILYDLDSRNCIHFTKEAARRLGLIGLDQPKLMRRPRSYLQAVAAANAGRVLVLDQHGKRYLASLAALPGPAYAPALGVVPPPVVPTL